MGERVSPKLLLSPDRLDLAVKWRFFRHLIEGDDPDSERVYRAHIMGRTGGAEPGSWKRSIEDYVRAAKDLLASMRGGFDARFPVPIGSNGRMRNGAHRVACALALGVEIEIERVEKPGTAHPWDEAWLRKGGLAEADIARAKQDLRRLHG